MNRAVAFWIGFGVLVLGLAAGVRVAGAEEEPHPRVVSVAVDPENARALRGVEIRFSSASGAAVSCVTDASGECTIDRPFPGARLVVTARTPDGRRGVARRVVLPPSGEVLVYVPVPPSP